MKGDTPRADIAGIRLIDVPSQRASPYWIDRRKSLALVTARIWFRRRMTYEIDRIRYLTLCFVLPREE
jgi:hypothetical protein